MRGVARLFLVLVAAGCATVAPAETVVQPTAQIIYVTPVPTVSPPPATPTAPVPTIVPPTVTAASLTFSEDDEKIDDIIRDGAAAFLALANRMGDPRPGETVIDVFEATEQFASSQQTLVRLYHASSCTSTAVRSYVEGLDIAEAGSKQFVDYYSRGIGTEPDSEDFAEAGRLIGRAVGLLDNSPCSD